MKGSISEILVGDRRRVAPPIWVANIVQPGSNKQPVAVRLEPMNLTMISRRKAAGAGQQGAREAVLTPPCALGFQAGAVINKRAHARCQTRVPREAVSLSYTAAGGQRGCRALT
jgi:hypothetical protein